jgi:hypothetical protein
MHEHVLIVNPALHEYPEVAWNGAQFDLNGRRLALSGADRVADVPGVMVKVGDLEAARERLMADGLDVGPIDEGPHESRCVVEGPGGWPLVLYAAKS